MRNLLFNGNQRFDQTDRVPKLRPLLDKLRQQFLDFCLWEQKVNIDEAMKPYFGRHTMKQFIKGKPVRFGYEVWCLNMKLGYLADFIIYQGRKGLGNKYKEEYGLGGGVV